MQKKAIEHPPSPLMIIAGAGTGKTFTLLHRIRHLVLTDQVKPEHILLLTFTEKATSEAQSTIKEILNEKSKSIFVGTFHSFCHSVMRRYGPKERINDVLWHDSDILYFLINHFNEMDFIKSRSFADNPVKAIRESFIPFFNRVSDELLSPSELKSKLNHAEDSKDWFQQNFPGIHDKNTNFDDTYFQLHDLVEAYSFFQKSKAKNNALDFGDMVLNCYKVLKNNKSILKQVRKGYRHIFSDEYQDNNYALNKIINLIAKKRPSITVVGDEDQCIYSFRGANYYNISDFRNRYSSHPNYAEIQLVENRRSTQEILDLANAVISQNPDRTPKILKCLPKNADAGLKPIWIQANKIDTLERLPQLIHSITKNGDTVYGDIAVICRGWGNVKDAANAMQNSAIPVDIHIENFFDVPIVKDVLSWGHLVCKDSYAEISLFRILRQQLSENWTSDFFKKMAKTTLDNKLDQLYKNIDNSKQVKSIIRSLDNLKRLLAKNPKVDEIIWEILTQLKDSSLVKTIRNKYTYSQRLNLTNTGELLNLAEQFINKDPNSNLKDWLVFMEIMSLGSNKLAEQPELKKENIAVNVMTIHQSKGLQFPIVIIPFLYSGSFPSNLKKHSTIDRLPSSWRAWKQNTNITFRKLHEQEERRVFYVGITRAEKELYLFGPTKKQSRFTKELENTNPQPMEINTMKFSKEKTISLSEKRQKLLSEINREIAAGQLKNAREILEQLENLALKNIEKTEISEINDNTLHLSSTKIETYSSCPLKYRLKYIDKIPERKTRATGEFGLIMHKILEEFHGLKNKDQTKETLFKLLEKHWQEDSFEYRQRGQEFKKQGEEILNHYFYFYKDNPPKVIGREKSFSFFMNDLNVKISGKIDRIDRDGKLLNIIDYKTSRKKSKAEKNLQLALYTEAILTNSVSDVKGKPGKAILHFLRHGDDPISSHSFSDQELEQNREQIQNVAEGIRKGLFETKRNDFNCKYCDYKDFLCPAWEE